MIQPQPSASDELPGRETSVGTVGRGGEGAGSAGGVALGRPAKGVARGPLKGKDTMIKCTILFKIQLNVTNSLSNVKYWDSLTSVLLSQ